jgi:hypothetical protein
MTTLKEAAQQALEALEVCEQDSYIPVRLTRDAITALRKALEQPEQQAVSWCMKANGCETKCGNCPNSDTPPAQPEHVVPPELEAHFRHLDALEQPVPDALGHVGFQEWWDAVADDYSVVDFKRMRRAWNAALKHEAQPAAQPEQEPSQWRDMVVVSLVREGINKHKARDLADHFATPPPAAQPEQEPIGWLDGDGTLAEFMHKDLKAAHDRCGSATPREFTIPVYLAPPAAQQRKPLTDEEIKTIAFDTRYGGLIETARAIEAAHGIKENT